MARMVASAVAMTCVPSAVWWRIRSETPVTLVDPGTSIQKAGRPITCAVGALRNRRAMNEVRGISISPARYGPTRGRPRRSPSIFVV